MPKEKGQEQPPESRVQNCHRNPNGTVVYDNPSNVMEVSPVCEEAPEAGTYILLYCLLLIYHLL